jgi:hypothetical protein
MKLQTRQVGIFAALVLLMASTRLYGHLGSSASLPDASWAVFFLAGFYLARLSWPAVAAFVFLLLEAGGVDYYAIVFRGVSDTCFSPAYWFMIPTYASLWYGGRWFAARQQMKWANLGTLAAAVWGSTTVAFLISNASYYLLSDLFVKLSPVQYAARVAQYYPQYLACTMLYLACAALLHVLLVNLSNTTDHSSEHV